MLRSYVVGQDRNDDHLVAHIYEVTDGKDEDGNPTHVYKPMCVRGWNRSDGSGISIFRGNSGEACICHYKPLLNTALKHHDKLTLKIEIPDFKPRMLCNFRVLSA